MENLQLVLFVLGAIAIIAVLVHGFWSIRKQQPKSLKDNPMSGFYKDQAARDANGFDADGIGEVRIRRNESDADSDNEPQMGSSLSEEMNHEPNTADILQNSNSSFSLTDEPKQKQSRQRQEPVLTTKVHGSDELNQMELGLGQETAPEQSGLFDHNVKSEPVESVSIPVYDEPVTEAKPIVELNVESKIEPKAQAVVEEPVSLPDPRDVLVLHVVASEDAELSGAELLPCLLTLNFKFGDMDIFHRHEDNAGTGKVLFSLANMVKPGIFNPDEMEQFSTEGVVLFMTLPCHGDPLMNFSIMLNSAHQLADDLGGKVLDGGRSDWSETTKQSYLQRIRTQL